MEGKEKSGKEVTIDYETFAALVGLCKAVSEVGRKLMAGTFAGNREKAILMMRAVNALASVIINSGAVDRDDALECASAAMFADSVRCKIVRSGKEGE